MFFLVDCCGIRRYTFACIYIHTHRATHARTFVIISCAFAVNEALEQVVAAKREKDEVLFDLREARKHVMVGGADGPADQHVDVASLEATIKAQAAEIAQLRAEAKQRGVTGYHAPLSERPHGLKRQDVKAQHGDTSGRVRRLSSEDRQSLAEQRPRLIAQSSVVSPSGNDIHRHKPLPHIGSKQNVE